MHLAKDFRSGLEHSLGYEVGIATILEGGNRPRPMSGETQADRPLDIVGEVEVRRLDCLFLPNMLFSSFGFIISCASTGVRVGAGCRGAMWSLWTTRLIRREVSFAACVS